VVLDTGEIAEGAPKEIVETRKCIRAISASYVIAARESHA